MKNNSLTLSQAINGYFLFARARRLSEHTLDDYQNTFNRFRKFMGDETLINKITVQDVQRFLAEQNDVSKKTVLNYHTGLSALWSWAIQEKFVNKHVVRATPRPKPEKKEIIPFTEAEIKALLASLKQSRSYTRPGKIKSQHNLPSEMLNRAMILLLLDTGVRASELASLRSYQVDRRNQRIQVMGKGARERTVPFSARTAQALWRYLTTRNELSGGDPLFLKSKSERPMTRDALGKILASIGRRTGIPNVYPHRFRHTFAIQFLRNGGDPYTLQRMLGHSTLETVKIYLQLAQIDLDIAHRRASPVDNWNL